MLIAVKRSFQCSLINVSCDRVEQVYVMINASPLSLVLGAVYIPPAARASSYFDFCVSVDEVASQLPCTNILLFGDYNLPRYNWSCPTPGNDVVLSRLAPVGGVSAHALIKETCLFHNHRQINACPNHRGCLLDVVFCNFSGVTIASASDPLLPIDLFHPALLANLQLCATKAACRPGTRRYNFSNGDYPRVIEFLNSVNWDSSLNGLSTDQAVSFLYDRILYAINSFIPLTRWHSPKYPSWFSPELIHLVNAKKAAHLAYKRSNDWHDYLAFCHLRSKCKTLSRSCYRGYIEATEASIPHNIKVFWKFVHSKRRTHDLPGTMHLGSVTSSDNSAIADMFAKHFESVYSAASPSLATYVNTNPPLNETDMSISIGEIYSEIEDLSVNEGPGDDGIPPIFLKKCKFILSRPLYIIFNRSLTDGHFPSAWKSSIVSPIHKSGARSDIKNYRPISMLNIMGKLFEAIVAKKISTLTNSTLSLEQHGFMSGRSTATNLAVFCNFVSRVLDDWRQVDVIYTDFTKAFDRVDHFLLIDKLASVGFGGHLLCWLFSYITGRFQHVRVGDALSRKVFASSGVPQGSHLDPILFLLFVDDIREVIRNRKFLMFADDLKLFKCISCLSDSLHLQSDLVRLSEWCLSNRMELNISKCHILRLSRSKSPILSSYTIAGAQLSTVEVARDLGVLIDSSFSFVDHIQHVVAASSRALGFITRNSSDFVSPSTIRYLYNSLVLPHLEYASVIWAPRWSKYRGQLERVQHRFLRYLAFKAGQPLAWFDHDYGPIMSRFGVRSLEHRRRVSDLSFLYRILNGLIDNPDVIALVNFNVPARCTRHTPLFRSPDYSSWVGHADPFHRICGIANQLHEGIDFFADTLSGFKIRTCRALIAEGIP